MNETTMVLFITFTLKYVAMPSADMYLNFSELLWLLFSLLENLHLHIQIVTSVLMHYFGQIYCISQRILEFSIYGSLWESVAQLVGQSTTHQKVCGRISHLPNLC